MTAYGYNPSCFYNLCMAHLGAKLFEGALADTVTWCRTKPWTMDVTTAPIRHRQATYQFAEQLWKEAIDIGERLNLRSVRGIKQYQEAVAFLEEIRDHLGPMERKLRSPQLRPDFSLDEFGNDVPWAQAVEEVVKKRAGLVSGLIDEQSASDAGGRVLLYTPSENLACGAADASSNGFFDTNNVPPWDLWIGFSNGTLVSWVPPAFVDVAAMGVFVNPEECIRWSDSQ